MRRALIAFSIFLVSLSTAAAAADATPPDQLVRQVTERVLALIKANRDEYARDHKKLFTAVDTEVLPYFDFGVMSRSVLALNWRRASDEQRERFVKEFRELLVRTYATALLKYTNEEVRYLPVFAKPEDKQILVRTEVVQGGGGANIPLHYSFYRANDSWKVYDVSIEGGDGVGHVEVREHGDADALGIAEDLAPGRHQRHPEIGGFVHERGIAGALQRVAHFLGDRAESLHQHFEHDGMGLHDVLLASVSTP